MTSSHTLEITLNGITKLFVFERLPSRMLFIPSENCNISSCRIDSSMFYRVQKTGRVDTDVLYSSRVGTSSYFFQLPNHTPQISLYLEALTILGRLSVEEHEIIKASQQAYRDNFVKQQNCQEFYDAMKAVPGLIESLNKKQQKMIDTVYGTKDN